MYTNPTLSDVVVALERVAGITVPEGDFEGDPLNHLGHVLTPTDAAVVDEAIALTQAYVRHVDGEPNRRSLTALTRRGFPVHLNQSQDDSMRLVGQVRIGDHVIDLSDDSAPAS